MDNIDETETATNAIVAESNIDTSEAGFMYDALEESVNFDIYRTDVGDAFVFRRSLCKFISYKNDDNIFLIKIKN